MRGTWQTGGGGAGFPGILQVAVLAGVAIGAAVIMVEFAWLIITLGVVAVAVRLYLMHRRTAAIAAIAEAGAREREICRAEAASALERKRAHEIEVARAGATVVQPVIQNIIDPALITAAIAAAVTGTQQYQYTAQPARAVIRGELGP